MGRMTPSHAPLSVFCCNMKHNNVIPNGHFRKYWQKYVTTWFNQPARKKSRREARVVRATRLFPRPVEGVIRPIVRCPSNKYNRRQRLGRGFTLDELKAAKINRREARGIGISLDPRRRNKSEETLRTNVARLEAYKANLVLFPKRSNAKKLKTGEASAEARSKPVQIHGTVQPLVAVHGKVQARKITADEHKARVVPVLRKAQHDKKMWGKRTKRAELKAAAAAAQ